MSAFRAISKHTRALSRTVPAVRTAPAAVRAFHSPFVFLSSPETTPPPAPSPNVSALYEKQTEPSPDPQLSPAGTRTYVVSAPDPADTPYEVPSGAYPTSEPYVNYAAATDAPVPEGARFASTSSAFAHPVTTTTAAVSQNERGVGESSAARHAPAPGQLDGRGGKTAGTGSLGERKPPPIGESAQQLSKPGVERAWKGRK